MTGKQGKAQQAAEGRVPSAAERLAARAAGVELPVVPRVPRTAAEKLAARVLGRAAGDGPPDAA
jgi:hypothetical protein